MDQQDEKTIAVVEKTGLSKVSNMDATSTDKVEDSDSAEAIKPDLHMSEDQYPHGLKLALLAGSSLIAVFLIALDQVSSLPFYANFVEETH